MKREVIGTPLFDNATKILLLGAGELGKEIVIEAQRLGVETITVDRYDNPPAAQVAHRHYTVNMLDGEALKAIVHREKPDAIVPEIEAINTDALLELEEEGFFVVPNAMATKITMDRILLRKLAAEKAGVPTSKYAFASNLDELYDACEKIGYPCLVKSRMSSGGLGSSIVFSEKDIPKAYEKSVKEARGRGDEVIVESIIKFDFEVTELVLAHLDEDGKITLSFPKPIGHVRSGTHYHVSWQPFLEYDENNGTIVPVMGYGSELHLQEDPPHKELLWKSKWNGKKVPVDVVKEVERPIYDVAGKVVKALLSTKNGMYGLGIFGCELFIKLGDEETGEKPMVYFNEISPRPHDTGMVTLITQDLSEMALHVRAILGLPIPKIRLLTPGASHVVLARKGGHWAPKYSRIWDALRIPGVSVRLFGKPYTYYERRMGVVLAHAENTLEARKKAMLAAHTLEEGIIYD